MTKSLAAVLLAATLPTAGTATAQAPPGTEIFVATLARTAVGVTLGAPINITARAGYDNQPSFTPDGRGLLYTSERDGQTDIFRFDFDTRAAVQLTRTPENEYSPTIMPDGRHFSVIRDSVQLLWSFTLEGNPVRPLLESIKPVGYHTWLNSDTVFVFVLGNPATLRRAELSHGTATTLATDIGRGLARVPGRRSISYVQRDSTGLSIRILDPVSGQGRTLIRMPEGNEFFAWTSEGDLISASGNRLLRWKEGESDWTEIARFTDPGLQRISRIAVSPAGDRIALVGAEPAAPQ